MAFVKNALFLVLLVLPQTLAYNWTFAEAPAQCSPLTVKVDGGSPPYRLLLVPTGPTPLSTNNEVRIIQDRSFEGNSNTLTFDLNFPANSQFVAVMSDATGFGSGGTTVTTQVSSSDDDSCFDASESVTPIWTFAIEPENQIVQCSATRIFWNPGDPQGTPFFFGVIPGGMSFAIPESNIDENLEGGLGQGFSWTPSVRGGTTLILVGADDRGRGSGGSISHTVSSGTTSVNSDCLNDDSPSSTPGNPAGQVATSTPSRSPDSDDSSPANVGAIIGGVVGGLIFIVSLVLVAFFYFRRRNREQKRYSHHQAVDLLNSDEGDESPTSNHVLPQYYEPEPFLVPDPTVASTSIDGRNSVDWNNRNSQVLSASSLRTPTPDLLGGSSSAGQPRKNPMRQLRPVNIIQHDDAGPGSPPPAENDPETIELPPAYTNIKPASQPGQVRPPPASSRGNLDQRQQDSSSS